MTTSGVRQLTEWCRRQILRLTEHTPTEQAEEARHVGAAKSFGALHRISRDARAIIESQFEHARALDQMLAEMDGQLGRAWQELRAESDNYAAILQRLMRVLDDCQAMSLQDPVVADFHAKLLRVLQEQAIEPIVASPGDRFSAEDHSCEQAEPTAEYPPGTLLRVLQTGYRRRFPDGSAVVIRPAHVVVSKGPNG
ncbi:MAG: nucleotide exchange factor GrpE [Pirellulales bacterium]